MFKQALQKSEAPPTVLEGEISSGNLQVRVVAGLYCDTVHEAAGRDNLNSVETGVLPIVL